MDRSRKCFLKTVAGNLTDGARFIQQVHAMSKLKVATQTQSSCFKIALCYPTSLLGVMTVKVSRNL